jgi:hypothetical protein
MERHGEENTPAGLGKRRLEKRIIMVLITAPSNLPSTCWMIHNANSFSSTFQSQPVSLHTHTHMHAHTHAHTHMDAHTTHTTQMHTHTHTCTHTPHTHAHTHHTHMHTHTLHDSISLSNKDSWTWNKSYTNIHNF